jgi:DNA-binding transcriptional MerR regulator
LTLSYNSVTIGAVSGDPAQWTIDRLARLAAAALAAGALAPPPNGRIREVPDVRTIRYYTSIGLLDRPGAMRGRTALYGRRHLAQLVAIKRLQAAGLTLTEVQQRLLGADAAAVERIAMLPEDAGAVEALEAAAEASEASADPVSSGSETEDSAAPVSRQRFWSVRPEPLPVPSAPSARPDTAPSAALVSGVRLASDVTLLLTTGSGRVPDAAERAAIAEAARPLMELLHRLGLSEA